MQYQKVIEQLGYSPKEAKVYLASLRLGEAHISDIAQKVQMPRTSVQTIVDKLHADGLMNFYVMRRYKYWVAENPERLLTNMRKREEAIEAALPELITLRNESRRNQGKKDAEQALHLVKITADNSPQPILVADDAADIVHVNEAWERQFGYTREEVQGQNTRMLASGETPKEVYENMWRTLHRGELFQTDQVTDKRKDGTTFSMATTIFIFKHGTHEYFVQVLQEK